MEDVPFHEVVDGAALSAVISRCLELSLYELGGFKFELPDGKEINIDVYVAGALEDYDGVEGEASDSVDRVVVSVVEIINEDAKAMTDFTIPLFGGEIIPESVGLGFEYHSEEIGRVFREIIASPLGRQLINNGETSAYIEVGHEAPILNPDFLRLAGAPESLVALQETIVERARKDALINGFGVKEFSLLQSAVNGITS